jgi:predicted Rossmann fold nucleotide-binding protein DprA/Smf involved in DNA uptake
MNNYLTDDTKAIILLCGVFGNDRSVNSLSQTEYNAIVRWLVSSKMRPEYLLQKDIIEAASMGSGIDKQRLEALLARGVQLGFAVEEWQRNGIWIISRSDTDYPARYKSHLKEKAPPLLFGVGDRTLLVGGGLAIVGSRNIDKDGEEFAQNIAELCALNKMPVVSGGARGVDLFAMNASLEAGGITVGVLAENLLKKSLERNTRNAIANGRLLLISPYHPNAQFTVGTAMSRNRLIYAMADYGLVVNAEHKQGGTWAGAEEELKRENPVTVFARMGENISLGNKKLLELGAVAWPEHIRKSDLAKQLNELSLKRREKNKVKDMSLFDFQKSQKETISLKNKEENIEQPSLSDETKQVALDNQIDSVYDAVLSLILSRLETPATVDKLSESLGVIKAQLNIWLKKAIDENKVIKLSRPIRYQKATSEKQV